MQKFGLHQTYLIFCEPFVVPKSHVYFSPYKEIFQKQQNRNNKA